MGANVEETHPLSNKKLDNLADSARAQAIPNNTAITEQTATMIPFEYPLKNNKIASVMAMISMVILIRAEKQKNHLTLDE